MLICVRFLGVILVILSLAALVGGGLPPGVAKLLLNDSAMHPDGAAGSLIIGSLFILTFRTSPAAIKARRALYGLMIVWSILMLFDHFSRFGINIGAWFTTPWRAEKSVWTHSPSLFARSVMSLCVLGHALLHTRRSSSREFLLLAILPIVGVGTVFSLVLGTATHFSQLIFSIGGATNQGLLVGVLSFGGLYLGWMCRMLGQDMSGQRVMTGSTAVRVTVVLMLLAGLLLGVSNSLIQALEGERRDHVEAHQRGQVEQVGLVLSGALQTADIAMDSPLLRSALDKINRDEATVLDHATISEFAKGVVSEIITGVRIRALRQDVLVELGKMHRKDGSVAYVLDHDLRMYWNQGVYINVARRVMRNGFPVGIVEFEMPLPELQRYPLNWDRAGQQSDSILCAPTDARQVGCMRLGEQIELYRLDDGAVGTTRAVTAAVDGSHGSLLAFDRETGLSLAAFGGLKAYPLGMVVQLNVQEVFFPVIQALRLIMLMCLLASCMILVVMFPVHFRVLLGSQSGTV